MIIKESTKRQESNMEQEDVVKILTHQGFKSLDKSQYELYSEIWKSYKELRKDDALRFLKEWESKYPNLHSHLFFYPKEIRSKDYKSWVDPKFTENLNNKWINSKINL
jgi:hypothetical protein